MDSYRSNVGRPPAKCARIVESLRSEIVSGTLPPGSRLPSRLQLQERYQASSVTLQRVIDVLASQGFVETRPRQGTHVAQAPPHLHRYGLALASSPGKPYWGPFAEALCGEARRLHETQQREIALFYDVDGHRDSEGTRRLLSQLRSRRLAGLVTTTAVETELERLGHDRRLDVPFVTIGTAPHSATVSKDHLTLLLDYDSFLHLSLDRLVASGRKKLGIVSAGEVDHFWLDFHSQLASRRIQTRPYWQVLCPTAMPIGARNGVECLMRLPADQRPDCLLVMDDAFDEAVMAGLVAAGVQVPDDLLVVTFSNFPPVVSCLLPCQRLGFDVPEVLRTALELIDRSRQGEAVSPVTRMMPVFEAERDPLREHRCKLRLSHIH